MKYNEFFEKYGLLKEGSQLDPRDLAGWMSAMDYFYCAMSKAQFLELVTDFYDNADEIFNSLNEDAQKMLDDIIQDIKSQGIDLTPQNKDNTDDDIVYDA